MCACVGSKPQPLLLHYGDDVPIILKMPCSSIYIIDLLVFFILLSCSLRIPMKAMKIGQLKIRVQLKDENPNPNLNIISYLNLKSNGLCTKAWWTSDFFFLNFLIFFLQMKLWNAFLFWENLIFVFIIILEIYTRAPLYIQK